MTGTTYGTPLIRCLYCGYYGDGSAADPVNFLHHIQSMHPRLFDSGSC